MAREANRIELGLAVSALSLNYGQRRTHRELAAFCGCTWGNIWMIERRALHKLKRSLYMRNDPALRELLDSYCGR